MTNFTKALILSAVTVLTAGCIKEDISKCNNVSVNLLYMGDEEDNAISKGYVSKTDLYIFDESGKYIQTLTQDGEQYTISTRLEPGRYTFAAVANAYDKTTTTNLNSSKLEEIFIQHPLYKGSDEITGHDANYIGYTTAEVYDRKEHNFIDLSYKSAHIDVLIEVYGLKDMEKLPYSITIENSNARTSLKNEIDSEAKETCIPELYYNAEHKCISTKDLKLFRMDLNGTVDKNTCAHKILVKDSKGNVLSEDVLYDFLQENKDKIDVTKQEVLLPIAIYFTDTTVDVKIPDWYIQDTEPGWE